MDDEPPVPFKQYFPKLSVSAYFWVVIGISALVFLLLGYFVGIRVNELPSSTAVLSQQIPSTIVPTVIPGDDNDTDYGRIVGTFKTNTNYYEQVAISIDSIQNGVETGLDSDLRDITKPQVGVVYPYSFARLDSSKTYTVSASACRVNPKTYALDCAKKINITNCTGTIQGKNCIIKWQGNSLQRSGNVDFSISKADNLDQ